MPTNDSLSPVHGGKRGKNLENVQQSNRALVLQLIKANGISTRKSLAEQSGLQPATISIIVAELISRRLIEETGLVEGDCGRRLTGLRLRSDRFCTVSVRITPSYYAVGLYDINSNCLSAVKTVHPFFEDVSDSIQQIIDGIHAAFALRPDLTPLGVSFAMQGAFCLEDGRCTIPSFMQEEGRDLGRWLREKLQLPVTIGLAADYGAYYYSAHSSFAFLKKEVFLFLLVSDTVDYSILDHGKIFQGALGLPGALGHLNVFDEEGNRASLESLCGNSVLLEKAARMLKQNPHSSLPRSHPLRSRDLINAFFAEDPIATSLYRQAAKALAQAVAILFQLLHPHRIFIGDEIPICERFFSLIRQELSNWLEPDLLCRIHISLPDAERNTRNDRTMMGGSMYLTDLCINTLRL